MLHKCPPLPFEVACLIDDAAKRRGKGVRDAVSVTVTSPCRGPSRPKAKKAFTEAMAAKNITYLPETQVTSIEEQDGRKLVKTSGDELMADLVLAAFPHRAPDFVKDLAKAKGLVPVDLRTNAVAGKEGVYCVGDACAALSRPPASHPEGGGVCVQGGAGPRKTPGGAGARRGGRAADGAIGAVRGRDGRRTGITAGPNFDAAFADPENGKPAFAIEPHADGTTAKVAWIQGAFGPVRAETSASSSRRGRRERRRLV